MRGGDGALRGKPLKTTSTALPSSQLPLGSSLKKGLEEALLAATMRGNESSETGSFRKV